MPIISIKNLSKKFGATTAVDNVEFSIEKGEIFGLLGPNGAGKSTLISMITTILEPDCGEIYIKDKNIKAKGANIKKLIGIVPQEVALYPSLTANENLAFWGRMYGLKGAHLKERIEYALEVAGLKDRAKEKISSYSGGMKRRINISAALLHDPEILIMDEPTVGIDPQSRNHILETVLNFNKKDMTVIYTSHYMEEVEYLCSRIAIMDYGKIIAMGTKEQLREIAGGTETINISASDTNEETIGKIRNVEGIKDVLVENGFLKIVSKNSGNILAKVVSILDLDQIKINSLDIEYSDLEAVFLHLTGRTLRD